MDRYRIYDNIHIYYFNSIILYQSMKFIFIILLFIPLIIKSQTHYLNGKITNKLGTELSEVSVVEKKSCTGTISNNDGTFRLLLKSGENFVQFINKGFETVTINLHLEKDTTIKIVLKEIEFQTNKKK